MSATAPAPVQAARPRILVADDHVIFVEGLSKVLNGHFDLVGSVNDGDELVTSAKRLSPDVIVTDLSMPGLAGFDAIRRLREEGCAAKFIVLTMHAEIEMAAEAFRAGACGYVLKQSASKELITAIDEVLCGRIYITPMIARDFILALVGTRPPVESQTASEPIHLSPRQKQVLQLVSEGRTMKEVGNILNISSRTAEAHKYEIMQVLGAKTTAQLVQYAIRFKIAIV
ncbi:MAG: response regulator transcription factor [Acidobacteriota bacterium]|nr:response regulator transcription factor [Acidobacteriota bacterium]